MEAIILANRLKYEQKNIQNYPNFKLEINNEKNHQNFNDVNIKNHYLGKFFN